MTAIGTSSRYLNAYALMTTGGIYEHQRATNPNRRVVMLTRSAFAGQQRNSMAIWTGDTFEGGRTVDKLVPLDILPLYVKAGSIVPIGPRLQYASEKPADPIELRVYPGADGEFAFYEDQNDGYGYEKGLYAEIPMKWDQARRELTIGRRRGSFPGMLTHKTFNIVVRKNHGVGDTDTKQPDKILTYSGKKVVVRL